MSAKTESIFRYPLHLESLGVLVFVTGLSYLLALASMISLVFSGGTPIYMLGVIPAFLLVAIFVEYGLEIISISCGGRSLPPALSFAMIDKGRFGRQLVMMLFFGSVMFGTFSRDLDYLGVLLICFVSLTFPASLALNSLYEDLYQIINPVTLIGFMVITGRQYLPATVVFALLVTAFYAAALSGVFGFLLFLPLGLYCLLVYFRFLGLTIYRHRASLLPEKDFGAEERQIKQFYDDNEKMHEVLEAAYWQLKENRVDAAIDLIRPLIELGNWARFDAIFEIVSQWSNKQPGLYFLKPYIPRLLARQNAMRALDLCQWGLKQDKDFTIEDETDLKLLVKACVSRQQFVVAVKLLDNFVDSNPGHESGARYLSLAADICQDRLHHQKKFDELRDKLRRLSSCSSPPIN